jgi:hypothetical protein
VYSPVSTSGAEALAAPEPSTIWLFAGGGVLVLFSRLLQAHHKRRSR